MDLNSINSQQNKFQESQKKGQKNIEEAAQFGKIFNKQAEEAQRHSVKAAEEAMEQEFREKKDLIEDGEGMLYEENEDKNIQKIEKKLEQKQETLKMLIQVARHRLGL